MYIYKKARQKRNSKAHALQSSVIFLIFAIITLVSIWLPVYFAAMNMSGT